MHHPKTHLTVVVEEAGVEERLSRRVAQRVSPETPSWEKHRARRAARAERVVARAARRPEGAVTEWRSRLAQGQTA